MADKKIKFTADENVSPVISRLKKDAEELGRGLIRDARAYTTSGKETLAFIEEQIKAIERRNKAEKEGQLSAVKIREREGEISPGQAKKEISGIGAASEEDKKQVNLLRELIDAVKNTSRREIVEDRKGVEKQLGASKTLEQLSPKGDEFKLLKESVQRQQLGDVKEQEREERDRFSGVKGALQRGGNMAQQAAGAPNEFYLPVMLAAMVPFIGGALSAMGQRAFGAAQGYQSARGELYGLTGSRGRNVLIPGMTYAETAGAQKQVALARGRGGGGLAQTTGDILSLERGVGLDRGLLLQQEKLGRGGAASTLDATQNLVRSLQGAGGIQGQDFSKLGEFFEMSISIQQEQLRVSGETNDAIASDLIAGISSLDDSFRNPEVLKGLMPQITGALSRPTTPQAEAFQMGILRQLNPGATLSELQEARENPTAEYFEATRSKIKEMFPDEEVGLQVMKGIFGLEGKTSIARKLYTGEVSAKDYFKEEEKGIVGLKGRAYGATGTLDRSSAAATRAFEVVGDKITDAIEKFKETGFDALKDFLAEQFGKVTKKLDNALPIGPTAQARHIIAALKFLGIDLGGGDTEPTDPTK